jgi:hypothetical protein
LLEKNWWKTAIVGGMVVLFFVLNKDFVSGELMARHDTFWNQETITYILKQWVDNGLPIGWNPYLNGGEPLYLYSNVFLWPEAFLLGYANKIIPLEPHLLFNLFLLFLFLNFAIGSFLLFSILFEDFRVALFCLVSLMFSDMFLLNLTQNINLTIICLFPYVLFGIFLFLKRGNIIGLVLSVLFFGLAANRYIPLYLLTSAGILVFFAFLAKYWPKLRKRFKLRFALKTSSQNRRLPKISLKENYAMLAGTCLLFLAAASPVLYVYGEIQNYVSPVRGSYAPGGELPAGEIGNQPEASAPASAYLDILQHRQGTSHHAFYFGLLPLLLIPIALFRSKDRYVWAFVITVPILFFLGLGRDFPAFNFLINYVPGFTMVRHTFPWAQHVSFLLICIAGFGLKAVLTNQKRNNDLVIMLLALAAWAVIFALDSFFPNPISADMGFLALLLFLAGLCVFLSIPRTGDLGDRDKKLYYFSLMTLLLLELGYSYDFKPEGISPLPAEPLSTTDISYPHTRALYADRPSPIPIDLLPMLNKEAVLSHPSDEFIFFRSMRLSEMLRHYHPARGEEAALGVDTPLIYVTQHAVAFKEESKQQMLMRLFEDARKRMDCQKAWTYDAITSARNRVCLEERKVFFLEEDIDFQPLSAKTADTPRRIVEHTRITGYEWLNLIGGDATVDKGKIIANNPSGDLLEGRGFILSKNTYGDYTLELLISNISRGGVVARWKGPDNFALLVLDARTSDVYWLTMENGVLSLPRNKVQAPDLFPAFGVEVRLNVIAKGDDIKLYHNEGMITSLTYVGRGKMGFHDNSGGSKPRQKFTSVALEVAMPFIPSSMNSSVKYTKANNPNQLHLVTNASAGYLVRQENYHPGWQAFIDGNETKIYHANYAFQSIRLPAGTHEVRFRFKTAYPMLAALHVAAAIMIWLLLQISLFRLQPYKV